MKFKSIFLTALAAVAVFASCQKPEEPVGAPEISLDPATLTIEEAGATETVALTATRTWRLDTTLPDWLEVTPVRGEASKDAQPLTIKVSKNEAGNRSVSLKFTIGLSDATLTVDQKGPKGDQVETMKIADFIAAADKTNPTAICGTVAEVIETSKYKGIEFYDETGYISAAFPENFSEYKDKAKAGMKITMSGVYSFFDSKKMHQIGVKGNNATILSVEEGEAFALPLVEGTTTVADFVSAENSSLFYELTGKLTGLKSEKDSFTLTDGTGSVEVFKIKNKDEFELQDGGEVTVIGRYEYYKDGDKPEVVSGRVKSFNMPEIQEVKNAAVADIRNMDLATPLTTKEVLVVAQNEGCYIIADGAEFISVWPKSGAAAVEVGDRVTVAGKVGMRNDIVAVIDGEPTVISSGNPLQLGEPIDVTATFDDYETSTKVLYVSYDGVLNFKDGKYFNVTVEGATKLVGSLKSPAAELGLQDFSGNKMKITGFHIGFSSNKESKFFNTLVTAAEPLGAYLATDAPASINLSGEASTNVYNVNTNAAEWSVAITGSEGISVVKEGNTIKVTATENTTANRKATITITAGEKTVTISVLQAMLGDPNLSTVDFSKLNYTGKYDKDEIVKVNGLDYPAIKLGINSDVGSVVIPASELKNGTFQFNAGAWKDKGDGIWTITATGCKIDGKASYQFVAKQNQGLNNNSPYTITTVEGCHFSVTLSDVTVSSSLEFTWTEDTSAKDKKTNKRMVLWGIQVK